MGSAHQSSLSTTKLYRPWTNVYGLARSLLALGTLVTLLVHDVNGLFQPLGREIAATISGDSIRQWSLFVLLSGENLEFARWIAIVILVLVVIGWRPRITGILHWWVSASYAATAVSLNGGDHVRTTISLLLIPLTLVDRRRWHWSDSQSSSGREVPTRQKMRGLVGLSSILAVRLQVSMIYLHAAFGKFGTETWRNGTAVYYWFTHPVFGVPSWLEPLILPIISSSIGVVSLTWGALILEIALAMGLFMKDEYRPYLLWTGLAFHAAIAVIHGLFAFFLAMSAALLIYLRPHDQPFPSCRWIGKGKHTIRCTKRLLSKIRLVSEESSKTVIP